MSVARDEKALQALAAVAGLAGFTLKSVATTDDFETRSITVKFTRTSDGHVQEGFDFEREPVQMAVVDGNGHVEAVTTLKPGDLAETEAQANAEIQAAAEQLPEAPGGEDENVELVGVIKGEGEEPNTRITRHTPKKK